MNNVPDPIADDAPNPEDFEDDATVRTPGTKLYDVVAYDYDGDRYCPECISEEYARLARHDPYQIPAGGAVDRGNAAEGRIAHECGNCRRIIEETQ